MLIFFPKKHIFRILSFAILRRITIFVNCTNLKILKVNINRNSFVMNKKVIIPLIIVIVILIGGVGYLYNSLQKHQEESEKMQELAALDKQEMENEYQQFANQYGEMRTQITNDSIIAQLTAEQERTEKLLAELKQVKSDDIKEITRLKKELATVRAVLRSYVYEIDSLNRLNQSLTAENVKVKGQYEEATKQIEGLNTEKASLSQKVAIAAQLDAVSIVATAINKHGKSTNKVNKAKNIQLNFNIAKNVPTAGGMKNIYVRIMTPNGTLLGNEGSFSYENKELACSMKKTVEYNGQETPVVMYLNVTQTLLPGTYQVSIFAEGNMIGSKSFVLN